MNKNVLPLLLAEDYCVRVALKGVKESDKQRKESSAFKSRGSEQNPLHSKLSLREESGCGWMYS